MRYVFPNSKIASSIAKTISYVTEYPLTICQKEVALLTGYRTWNELNVFHSPKNHYISYEMIKDNINKTNLIKKIIKYRSLTYLLNILNLKYKKNFNHSEIFLEDRAKIILDDIPNMDNGIFIFENFNFEEHLLSKVELLILETVQNALNKNAHEITFTKTGIILRLSSGTCDKIHFDEKTFILLKEYLKKYSNFNDNFERVFSGKINANWLPECIHDIQFVYDENILNLEEREKNTIISFKLLKEKYLFYYFDDIEKNKIIINTFFQKFMNINKNVKKFKKDEDNFDSFLKRINHKNKYIIDLKNYITNDQHHILSKISEEYNVPIYIFKNNLHDTTNSIPGYNNLLKIYMNEFKKYDYSLYTASIKNDEVYRPSKNIEILEKEISMLYPKKNIEILGKLNKDEILAYDEKVLFFYNYYSEISYNFLNQNKNIVSRNYNNNIFAGTVRHFLKTHSDIIFINNIQMSEIHSFIYLAMTGHQLKGYYNPGPYLTKKMIDKKIINSLK